MEKCVFAEDRIVNIDVQDPSPIQVFAKTVGLEGLLSLLKTQLERYVEQNGRMLQNMLEELCVSGSKHFNGYSQTSSNERLLVC